MRVLLTRRSAVLAHRRADRPGCDSKQSIRLFNRLNQRFAAGDRGCRSIGHVPNWEDNQLALITSTLEWWGRDRRLTDAGQLHSPVLVSCLGTDAATLGWTRCSRFGTVIRWQSGGTLTQPGRLCSTLFLSHLREFAKDVTVVAVSEVSRDDVHVKVSYVLSGWAGVHANRHAGCLGGGFDDRWNLDDAGKKRLPGSDWEHPNIG
jgi:hypothetical protein